MVLERGVFIDYYNLYIIYFILGVNVIDFIDFLVRCIFFDEVLSMFFNLGFEVLVVCLDIKKVLMLFLVYEYDFY